MRNGDDVEELLQIAAKSKNQDALRQLFHALRSVEIFMPFEVAHQEGKEVKATPLLRLPDGSHAMMAYTSKSHPDLPDKFGGAMFEVALAAALKMPALDWVILTNQASQWVSINKEQIPAILDDLQENPNQREIFVPSAQDASFKMVEGLITRAVESKSARLLAMIGSALADRELFLEMSTRQREDGRDSMNTFKMEPVGLVVRAYTTRVRPGIRYGGIRWPALREMIRALPDISGVQIMNDADDWIVFDREALGLNADSQS
jgi:hypothetical protein